MNTIANRPTLLVLKPAFFGLEKGLRGVSESIIIVVTTSFDLTASDTFLNDS